AGDVATKIDALDILMLAAQNKAYALMELGKHDRAETVLGEAIGHYAATRNLLRHAECLEVMGRINEVKPDNADVARRCYELAADMAEKVSDRALLERVRGRLASMRGPQPPRDSGWIT